MAVVTKLRLSGMLPLRGNILELSAITAMSAVDGSNANAGITITGNFTPISGDLSDLLTGNLSTTVQIDTTLSAMGFMEIVLTFPSPTDVGVVLFGSCDIRDRFIAYCLIDRPHTSYTNAWQPHVTYDRTSQKVFKWPGARTLQEVFGGVSSGDKFFDTSQAPGNWTIDARGTNVSVTSPTTYDSVVGSRVFDTSKSYYFEAIGTDVFFGFAPLPDQRYLGNYFGTAAIPGSIGFGANHQYVNYVSAEGTGATWTSMGSPINVPERMGYHVDLPNKRVDIYRGATFRYRFDMVSRGLGSITEWYLGICNNSPTASYSIQFYDKPETILHTPPVGATVGMGYSMSIESLPNDLRYKSTLSETLIMLPTHTTPELLGPQMVATGYHTQAITYAGMGYIKATAMVQGTPNYPVARRVVLFAVSNDLPIRETVSDPITGLFEFKFLDERFMYNIMVQDTTGAYITTASGPIRPKRMPGT